MGQHVNKRDSFEQKEAAKDEIRRIVSERQDFEATFGTPHGKRVLAWIMRRGLVHQTTFTGNSQGMMLEGKRLLALEIADKVPYLVFDVWTQEENEKREQETKDWNEIFQEEGE